MQKIKKILIWEVLSAINLKILQFELKIIIKKKTFNVNKSIPKTGTQFLYVFHFLSYELFSKEHVSQSVSSNFCLLHL